MKLGAYAFAHEVDLQIEALSDRDYHCRIGRSKLLQEELLPISRLGLHLKQYGLVVEVEAFESNAGSDGHIQLSGDFREREFDVEVTYDYSYEEALRDELLHSTGFAPGAGAICCNKKSREVIATLAVLDSDEHIGRITQSVMNLFRKKNAPQCQNNTALIIAFDEVHIHGLLNWSRLFVALQQEGGLSGSGFIAVYLFNCANNEIQQAA